MHDEEKITQSAVVVLVGLAIAQLLAAVGQLMVVIVAGIIGSRLAPDQMWATLPAVATILGVATAAFPVARLIGRFGYRKIFILSLVWVSIGALVASLSISAESFVGFCMGCYMIGNNMATVAQYRFAAAASVPKSMISNAVAIVMLGMLGAALLAPWLSIEFQDLLSVQFSGSFLVLPLFFIPAALIIAWLPMQGNANRNAVNVDSPLRLRPVLMRSDIQLAILAAAGGYGLMSLIMTATPISMHVTDGHSVEQTADVIRAHLLSMFVPSLFSGWLIAKLGNRRMLWAGVLLYLGCILIAISGQEVWQYRAALIALGVGWNFLFVGGTTLLAAACPTESAIRVQGINETVMFGTMAVCALSAGALLNTFGWVWTNLGAALIVVIIVVAMLRARSKSPAGLISGH